MIIKERGITEEVFTLYSGIAVGDIVNRIGEIKCEAAINWIHSSQINVEETVIVGAYITGMKLAEQCKNFSNVTVIDIQPHLKHLLSDDVEFSDDLTLIKNADLIIDTTGLGGLSPETVREYVNMEESIFLAEDPTSDGSDTQIIEKSNIQHRVEVAGSKYAGILKTSGLNTKTSGTMTLTMEVLRKSLEDILKSEGVLYGVAGMNFYEGVIFKEKDHDKFHSLLDEPALIISALQPLSSDDIIEGYLDKISSGVGNVTI